MSAGKCWWRRAARRIKRDGGGSGWNEVVEMAEPGRQARALGARALSKRKRGGINLSGGRWCRQFSISLRSSRSSSMAKRRRARRHTQAAVIRARPWYQSSSGESIKKSSSKRFFAHLFSIQSLNTARHEMISRWRQK